MRHSLAFRLASILIIAVFVIAEAASVGSSAYALIQNKGSNLARRQTLNFTGAGVTCTDGSGKTTCNISGGGGGGGFYQTIQQGGVSLPQEAILNFAANTTCVDVPGVSTDCTPSGGGGGGGNSITFGTYPTFPGSPAAGDLFYASNSPHLFSWNGSAWKAYNGSIGTALSTWTNSGSYSATNATGLTLSTPDLDPIIAITGAVSQAIDSWHGYTISSAVLAAPPYTVKLHINNILSNGLTGGGCGLMLQDTLSAFAGRLQTFHQIAGLTAAVGNGGNIGIVRFSDPTGGSPGLVLNVANQTQTNGGGIWLKIVNDATNRTYSISSDNIDYQVINTELISTSWLPNGEDTLGIGWYTISNAIRSTCRYDSLSVTNP